MKVSIRVAHSRCCPNRNRTTLESVNAACRRSGCRPAYFTLHRQRVGNDRYKPVKGERVHDKQTVERERDRLQRELDAGRLGHVKPKAITFPHWVDRFSEVLASAVDKGDIKPRTERDYAESLLLAKDAIGYIDVRQIGAAELRRFDDLHAKQSAATRARHLKHLSRCLAVALDDGYLDANPVPAFKRSLKLQKRIPKRGKAPFEDAELVRLYAALDDEDAPVYRYIAEFSAETGMRIGELAALDWSRVSLAELRVRVEWTWNDKDGQIASKTGEGRTIYLTPQAADVLERWARIAGDPADGPVFPSPDSGGRLSIRAMQRRFEKALENAGIPKVHAELGKPRSFHSLRYTTSVLMQRRGLHPRYIEQTLGHGTLELSYGLYGGWTPEQLAAEAARSTPLSVSR